MTYALFPQVGIKFLENRDNPDFFEPVPKAETESSKDQKDDGVYTVSFKGQSYTVKRISGWNYYNNVFTLQIKATQRTIKSSQ